MAQRYSRKPVLRLGQSSSSLFRRSQEKRTPYNIWSCEWTALTAVGCGLVSPWVRSMRLTRSQKGKPKCYSYMSFQLAFERNYRNDSLRSYRYSNYKKSSIRLLRSPSPSSSTDNSYSSCLGNSWYILRKDSPISVGRFLHIASMDYGVSPPRMYLMESWSLVQKRYLISQLSWFGYIKYTILYRAWTTHKHNPSLSLSIPSENYHNFPSINLIITASLYPLGGITASYFYNKLQMSDIGVVRGEVLEKYKELCRKINHEPNSSFTRNFAAVPAKSFYLDLVFRGNDKLNFANRFSDRDLILLASALEGHEKLIRHVDLSFNELTDVGLEIFAKFLERCPNLQSLNLQGNALGSPSAELLSGALAHSQNLKYLNLQYNKVGTAGAISITKNLLFASSEDQGRSLQELNLGDTGLDIDGVICVTSVLNWNNSSLRSLCLDAPEYKSIGQECAIHFAKMLQVNRGLEKLSLRKNQLNCDAIYTIKQLCLENNRLRVLDLSANKIAFKGAEAIHDILTSKFCVLEALNLSANRLGHYGAKAISQALAKNRTLIHLDLTRNSIDDNGLKMLAQSLQTNDSLVSLKLYFNDFGQQSLRQFHKLAKRMEKLTTYWDFTTYVVDNEIQMAQIDNNIKYDVQVARKYYC